MRRARKLISNAACDGATSPPMGVKERKRQAPRRGAVRTIRLPGVSGRRTPLTPGYRLASLTGCLRQAGRRRLILRMGLCGASDGMPPANGSPEDQCPVGLNLKTAGQTGGIRCQDRATRLPETGCSQKPAPRGRKASARGFNPILFK